MTLDKQALQAAISKAGASTFFEGGETYAEFVIRAYLNALKGSQPTLQEEMKRLRLDNSLNEERVSSLMNERTNLIKTSRETITRYQEMLAREANEKVVEHRRAEAAEARVRELEAALKSKGE